MCQRGTENPVWEKKVYTKKKIFLLPVGACSMEDFEKNMNDVRQISKIRGKATERTGHC